MEIFEILKSLKVSLFLAKIMLTCKPFLKINRNNKVGHSSKSCAIILITWLNFAQLLDNEKLVINMPNFYAQRKRSTTPTGACTTPTFIMHNTNWWMHNTNFHHAQHVGHRCTTSCASMKVVHRSNMHNFALCIFACFYASCEFSCTLPGRGTLFLRTGIYSFCALIQ